MMGKYKNFTPYKHVKTVKAISDTVEHLVPRPLPARPRNSIWRQAKEWSLKWKSSP